MPRKGITNYNMIRKQYLDEQKIDFCKKQFHHSVTSSLSVLQKKLQINLNKMKITK